MIEDLGDVELLQRILGEFLHPVQSIEKTEVVKVELSRIAPRLSIG